MTEIVHREIRVRESSKEEVIPTDRKNRLTGVRACDTSRSRRNLEVQQTGHKKLHVKGPVPANSVLFFHQTKTSKLSRSLSLMQGIMEIWVSGLPLAFHGFRPSVSEEMP